MTTFCCGSLSVKFRQSIISPATKALRFSRIQPNVKVMAEVALRRWMYGVGAVVIGVGVVVVLVWGGWSTYIPIFIQHTYTSTHTYTHAYNHTYILGCS